jgi:hypothetical protein
VALVTPEELAPQDIDRLLAQCGWQVQSRNEMSISAALRVAVREFVMLTGEADYLLYAAGKAIGVVEAKPRGHPLIGLEGQSAKYVRALPPSAPAHGSPLNLDIFWLKDTKLEDADSLPEPDVLAQEIAEDLQAAMELFAGIANELREY